MWNVYTSLKWSRKASSTTSKEQEVEDIWVAATEADKEGTIVMAVVVPVAAVGGPDDGVGGIYSTLGHFEEELLMKTKPGTERTTAAESSSTGAGGDAPIHQGEHNMCALVGAVHTVEEPITVRATDTSATVHGTGPPLLSKPLADRGCSQTHVLLLTCMQDGGWEQMDDVVVGIDVTEEAASANGPRPCLPPLTRTCDRYIQNIVEDNRRISYSVPRHTMTDAVASTYAVYHNHEYSVPGYAVQV
ncbi:hypothetical protein Cgig2_007991 [Carnegiea gigantea]|uniref:Uncharacterized protein n=1 Tax=Carnegiea gigantea TaxID=171969 RepID=A0A9Q1GUT9_9CARY|nr:hypothetical protein Cgig2_007991 [Carnegiea gigantea]